MPWFFLVLFLSFICIGNFSEGRHDQKQSAIIVGTVYCDTCFQQFISKSSHFISGATVAVECKDGNSRPSFKQQVRTNENGEFKVQLPFTVSKHVKRIEGCEVKLVKSSEPYCAVASTATSSSLHLKSRKHGAHVFSAGFFTFKPLKQPTLCNQKPSLPFPKQLKHSAVLKPNQFFPPVLPPNPLLPPPAPLIPNPLQPPPAPLIPNPFQPPPAPLIPNPFQPPPAPVIPNPFQPPPAPPSPLFPFPPIPIPGLTPSPPPPPPPVFPFPLPPLPPIPPFPGIPPASTSPKKSSP